MPDVRAQREGRLTPWTHLWTQPGTTLGTRTLKTQMGMCSHLVQLHFFSFLVSLKSASANICLLFLEHMFFFLFYPTMTDFGANDTDFKVLLSVQIEMK